MEDRGITVRLYKENTHSDRLPGEVSLYDMSPV